LRLAKKRREQRWREETASPNIKGSVKMQLLTIIVLLKPQFFENYT